MTALPPSPIGILAGSGSLPVEIARAIRASGGEVQIVAINPDIDAALSAFPLVRLGLGQVGAILRAFRSARCRELVIVGANARPDLATLRPDLGLLLNLPRVARLLYAGGDDGLLRIVVRFFEAKGFTVVGPGEIMPALVVGAGALTRGGPSVDDAADILLGSSIVKTLGRYDVGQAVIVSGGAIIAIEAAEGTDKMLARVAERRNRLAQGVSADSPPRGVLVKRPKPDQELRIDLPAIGPATVKGAVEAGLAGIAVLAGQALAAERPELIARANAAHVFVYGFTEGNPPTNSRRVRRYGTARVEVRGRHRPGSSLCRDARLGADALASLEGSVAGAAAVVSRGQILALETTGDTTELFARAQRLQQWGLGRLSRRMSVGVLGCGMVASRDTIDKAALAGLAGIAVIGGARDHTEAAGAADAAGLFLVRLMAAEPRP